LSGTDSNKSKFQKNTKETVHRSQLKGAPYNPRKINKVQAKRLREGLKTHGLVGGILWNRRTGNLVGGHQRINQLDTLEGSQDYSLEVDVIDVDELQEKEINILLNNQTAQGEFDEDKLADLVEHLREENRNVERTGFTMADMQAWFGDTFLEGGFADQRDEEASVIDALNDLRTVGREAEAEFFEGVEPPIEGKERVSTTVPTPSTPRDATGAPVGEPPKKDYTEELKRRKEEIMAENAEAEDADYMITFVFDNAATRDEFLLKFRLPHKHFFNREEIEAAFDVELT